MAPTLLQPALNRLHRRFRVVGHDRIHSHILGQGRQKRRLQVGAIGACSQCPLMLSCLKREALPFMKEPLLRGLAELRLGTHEPVLHTELWRAGTELSMPPDPLPFGQEAPLCKHAEPMLETCKVSPAHHSLPFLTPKGVTLASFRARWDKAHKGAGIKGLAGRCVFPYPPACGA